MLQSSVLCRVGIITSDKLALMTYFKQKEQDVKGKVGLLYYSLP